MYTCACKYMYMYIHIECMLMYMYAGLHAVLSGYILQQICWISLGKRHGRIVYIG